MTISELIKNSATPFVFNSLSIASFLSIPKWFYFIKVTMKLITDSVNKSYIVNYTRSNHTLSNVTT